MLDTRASGIPVLSLGVGDVFGGASVLACATDRLALLPGTRLGLSGPRVIEFAQGREQLLLYRIGNYKRAPYACEAWIRAVVASCARGVAMDCLLIDDSVPQGEIPAPLPGIAPEQAQEILTLLVSGYLEGRTRPLCFAPETSAAYAAKATDKPDPVLLEAVADSAWYQDSNYSQGEGHSSHAQLAWRGRDPFDATHVEEWHHWATHVSAHVAHWGSNK